MKKKVKEIKISKKNVKITLKNGEVQELPSKTMYTYYEDGSNDCKVEIQKPLKLSGKFREVK